jgi:hypothetical protein
MITHRARRVAVKGRAALLLTLGSTLAVVACGDLPKPFQHDSARALSAPLVRLSTANQVEVWPPLAGTVALPDDLRQDWAEQIAAMLRDKQVPAVVAALPAVSEEGPPPAPPSYAMAGQVVDSNPDQVVLRLTLFAPEGKALSERPVRLENNGSIDPQSLKQALNTLTLALEADMEAPLTKRMAAPAAAPLPSRMAAPTTSDEIEATLPPIETLPPVALGAIEGFGESRDRILSGALKRQLTRIGVKVEPSAEMTVLAEIAKEVYGDSIRLQIVWRLVGPNGQELGNIKQANPVPAELIEKQFPALAVAIAEGGADGLVALLAQLQHGKSER